MKAEISPEPGIFSLFRADFFAIMFRTQRAWDSVKECDASGKIKKKRVEINGYYS